MHRKGGWELVTPEVNGGDSSFPWRDLSLPGEGDTIGLTLGQAIHSESRGRKRTIIPFSVLEGPCPHTLFIKACISSLHLPGHFSFPTS